MFSEIIQKQLRGDISGDKLEEGTVDTTALCYSVEFSSFLSLPL
jgi:hypothetical protein